MTWAALRPKAGAGTASAAAKAAPATSSAGGSGGSDAAAASGAVAAGAAAGPGEGAEGGTKGEDAESDEDEDLDDLEDDPELAAYLEVGFGQLLTKGGMTQLGALHAVGVAAARAACNEQSRHKCTFCHHG